MTEQQRTGIPKVCVYAIALNEEQNINGWAEAAAGADAILIADTGSTDKSVELARQLPSTEWTEIIVAEIGVFPFRFDVARNAALALVPGDVDFCLAVDLDERLRPGWREAIDDVWREGANQATFMFHWGPGVSFRYDRFHARRDYTWKGAAHEFPAGPGPKLASRVEVDHLRDQTKDRSQYFDLLMMSYREEPDNPRHTYYLGREHYYRNEWVEARKLFDKYLSMRNAFFDQERAEACRMQARIVWPKDRERWILRACYEAPQRRECWSDLAKYYGDVGNVAGAEFAVERALAIREVDATNGFHVEADAWSEDTLRQHIASARTHAQRGVMV
jgi:glycosyltransferase involved in cell wall biosynthesis